MIMLMSVVVFVSMLIMMMIVIMVLVIGMWLHNICLELQDLSLSKGRYFSRIYHSRTPTKII